MAATSFFMNAAALEIAKQTLDLDTATLKVMLIGTATAYTPDRDTVFIDEAGSNDLIDAELNGVANYTRGFGNAGREVAAISVATIDTPNDRIEWNITDITWTALGTGDTITGAALVEEITNDAASKVIAFFELTNTPTNGGDVTLDFSADGSLRLIVD